jgi:CheY-like chemotaxis protein
MVPTSAAPLANRRILLIEDDADTREATRRHLETLGAQVAVATDGIEGLAHLARDPWAPDAVLCDLAMPIMDGFEFARRMRGIPHCQQVLLIAVTGYGRNADFDKTWRTGFDEHLVKPLTDEALAAFAQRLALHPASRIRPGAGP